MLAKQVPAGVPRDQLLEMASTWNRLAETREGLVRNQPSGDPGQTAGQDIPSSGSSRTSAGT